MRKIANESPEALTMEQAIERAKGIYARYRRLAPQARELAEQGRGGDTEVAHVTLGELVIPRALQSAEVLDALKRAAAAHDIPLETLIIGSAANRINPRTGAPEFAGFDPNQPRVQKGQGEHSGEWRGPGMGTMQIPIPQNDVIIDSGIVRPSARVRKQKPQPYNPRLVPARKKDLELPEVKAFLDTISLTEGAGFHTVLGDDQFPLGRLAPDFSQFPNRGPDNGQTASGAYQIEEDTYDDLASQMGLEGFDPETQRLMAAQLLQRAVAKPGTESALEALRRGDYDAAVRLSGPTWVSLPGAKEDKKRYTADQVRAYYDGRLRLYKSQQR